MSTILPRARCLAPSLRNMALRCQFLHHSSIPPQLPLHAPLPRILPSHAYARRSLCSGANATAIENEPSPSPSSPAPSSNEEQWKIKMLYDGDCPLCMREVNMLRDRDARQGNICFVDVADPSYTPSLHANISYEQAMERIHAVLPDGTVVTNVEVFRRLYEQVGLGWVYSITRVPGVEAVANAVYDVWAKYRLPITGRPDMAVVLASRKKTCRDSESA